MQCKCHHLSYGCRVLLSIFDFLVRTADCLLIDSAMSRHFMPVSFLFSLTCGTPKQPKYFGLTYGPDFFLKQFDRVILTIT